MEKKKRSRSSKLPEGNADSSSIESRLRRMEALLRSSTTASNLPTQSAPPQSADELASPSSMISEQATVNRSLSDRFSNLIIGDRGQHVYIGSSSGFSLLSPRGLAWVERKTGSSNLAASFNLNMRQPGVSDLNPNTWNLAGAHSQRMLPSKQEATKIVEGEHHLWLLSP